MIKKGTIIIIACTLIIILNSCCKADCINRSIFLSFNKLRAVNTDSVSFLSYTAGTNFTQITDSMFILTPVAASDTSFSNVYRDLFAGLDWKIINHSLNKEYRLNNFEIEKVKCCGERAYVVRSFQLNGVSNSGSTLLIGN
jgi:hypothetical protein